MHFVIKMQEFPFWFFNEDFIIDALRNNQPKMTLILVGYICFPVYTVYF